MGIAYFMYKTGWEVNNTTNKGNLLIPMLSIKELPLDKNSNLLKELFSDNQVTKKWRLLLPITGNCTQICQKNLYITRQVHIRLGEKAHRLERIALVIDNLPQSMQGQLMQEHPHMLYAGTSNKNFFKWLTVENTPGKEKDYYYLIDQRGFVMMHYNVLHTGQDLLDDLRKLLKFTYSK